MQLMQLFSVGLWDLNPDGTYILDGDGDVIQTYGTHNIMTFARLWTGWDRRALRGNLETENGNLSPNHIDPMEIKPKWRDPFPKSDLYRGHIGDAHPLCNDLSPRHFLSKGALYRYRGDGKKAQKTLSFQTSTSWLHNTRGRRWRGPYTRSQMDWLLEGTIHPNQVYEVNNSKLTAALQQAWGQWIAEGSPDRWSGSSLTDTSDTKFYKDFSQTEWDEFRVLEEVTMGFPYYGFTRVNGMYFQSYGSYALDRSSVSLSQSKSSLYAALCSNSTGGKCTFPTEVRLPEPVPCFDRECRVSSVRLVRLHVHNAKGRVVETAYYEYVDPPCVKLTFFNNGKHLQYGHSDKSRSSWAQICENPESKISKGAPCCKQVWGSALESSSTYNRAYIDIEYRDKPHPTTGVRDQRDISDYPAEEMGWWNYERLRTMEYGMELLDYKTSEERCARTQHYFADTHASHRPYVCDDFKSCSGHGCSSYFLWQSQPCRLQVQVGPTGLVSIVQPNMGNYSKVIATCPYAPAIRTCPDARAIRTCPDAPAIRTFQCTSAAHPSPR